MDDAISCVEYLQAAFPLEGELVLSEATAQQLLEAPPTAPTTLEASIFLKLEEPPQEEPLQVDVSLPTTSDAGPPSLSLRQPSYFTRAQHHELCQSLSPVASVDDLYMVLEEIKPAAAHILQAAAKQHQATAALKAQRASPQFTGPLVRAWFWFITISTREKRGHMTQWGPQYGLSGFLLAGKPGILCLEGRTDAIDAFWKEIKTSSWAEIPSFQKKVTERHRETLAKDGSDRKFQGMEEIDVARRGSRGNRGDMGELQEWMRARGVGDAFDKVILTANA